MIHFSREQNWVGCHWVYTIKCLPNGSIECLKERSVAGEYSQRLMMLTIWRPIIWPASIQFRSCSLLQFRYLFEECLSWRASSFLLFSKQLSLLKHLSFSPFSSITRLPGNWFLRVRSIARKSWLIVRLYNMLCNVQIIWAKFSYVIKKKKSYIL